MGYAESLQWTYLVCFAVFELGSLLCGLASSSMMLIVGRAIAGLGASGLQNGALTIIAGSVPMARRPGACDTYSLVGWLIIVDWLTAAGSSAWDDDGQ